MFSDQLRERNNMPGLSKVHVSKSRSHNMETGANKHIQIKQQLGNENFFIADTRKNVDDDNDTNYLFWMEKIT